ncbi:MAG: hypothetical protein HY300_12320 [Verrucomicrobia bacterium]|nr:hypothetical protein [Verrucomicrobiota bacterium]
MHAFLPLSVALLALTAACHKKTETAPSSVDNNAVQPTTPGPKAKSINPGAGPATNPKTASGALDLDAINLATTRFMVDLNRPPKDLQELVREKYLASLPAPPPGQKIVFDKPNAKFVLVNQ